MNKILPNTKYDIGQMSNASNVGWLTLTLALEIKQSIHSAGHEGQDSFLSPVALSNIQIWHLCSLYMYCTKKPWH